MEVLDSIIDFFGLNPEARFKSDDYDIYHHSRQKPQYRVLREYDEVLCDLYETAQRHFNQPMPLKSSILNGVYFSLSRCVYGSIHKVYWIDSSLVLSEYLSYSANYQKYQALHRIYYTQRKYLTLFNEGQISRMLESIAAECKAIGKEFHTHEDIDNVQFKIDPDIELENTEKDSFIYKDDDIGKYKLELDTDELERDDLIFYTSLCRKIRKSVDYRKKDLDIEDFDYNMYVVTLGINTGPVKCCFIVEGSYYYERYLKNVAPLSTIATSIGKCFVYDYDVFASYRQHIFDKCQANSLL